MTKALLIITALSFLTLQSCSNTGFQQDIAMNKSVNGFAEKVDSIVAGKMNNYNIPGLSIGLVMGDAIVYAKGYGLKRIDNPEPVTEYVCVPEKMLSQKPSNISFNDAGALPHAGILALQGLVDKGKVASGQRVLINGAGGGVGTLGIQILKPYGVNVTGVDNAEKLGLMKSLGYDSVIDYKKVDFSDTGEKYDLILDTKSTRSVFKVARSLKRNGTYITMGGSMYRVLETSLLGSLISLFTGKKLKVLIHEPNKGLDRISKLVEKGKIKPVVDGPYKFDKIPELIQYFGEGRHFGKIVVEI